MNVYVCVSHGRHVAMASRTSKETTCRTERTNNNGCLLIYEHLIEGCSDNIIINLIANGMMANKRAVCLRSCTRVR